MTTTRSASILGPVGAGNGVAFFCHDAADNHPVSAGYDSAVLVAVSLRHLLMYFVCRLSRIFLRMYAKIEASTRSESRHMKRRKEALGAYISRRGDGAPVRLENDSTLNAVCPAVVSHELRRRLTSIKRIRLILVQLLASSVTAAARRRTYLLGNGEVKIANVWPEAG